MTTDLNRSLSLAETKSNLDAISSTFCGAKWTQVLFQFHLGTLHNCCLTQSQPIDLNQLFNSKNLIRQREEFLAGKKEADCGVCWKAEESGFVSDRLYKSSEPNVRPLYESKQTPKTVGVIPSYIEVSLSNRCQFKCAYCSPENSSSLFGEVKTHGSYQLTEEFNAINQLERNQNYFLETDENPFVDAFVKWYPEIYREVKVLRFTGGEPLLSNRLFEILNLLKTNPSPELELIFNSNLGISEKILDKFLSDLKQLPENSYGKLCFITSVDGWDEGAKLARWGLDFSLFERNLLKIREIFPEAKIRFTATMNVLAVSGLKKLLEKVCEWKITQSYHDQILITSYPLHYPAFLSLKNTDSYFLHEISEALNFINDPKNQFLDVEKDMLQKAFADQDKIDPTHADLIDFTLFMFQHQQRKKWAKEILPEKLKAYLEKGLIFLQSGNFSSQIAIKSLPWIQIDQSLLRDRIKSELQSGQYNPWAVLHILITFAEYLEPAWIDWWFENNVPEGGIKLMEHPKFHSYEHFQVLVVKMAMGARSEFWEALGNTTIIGLLQKRTLDRLFMFASLAMTDVQLNFWKKVKTARPDYVLPGKLSI